MAVFDVGWERSIDLDFCRLRLVFERLVDSFSASSFTWLGSAALVTTYMSNQEKKERALLMQLFSRHVRRKLPRQSGKSGINLWSEAVQGLKSSP